MIIAQQKRTLYTIIISSLVVLAAGVAFALYLKNTAAEPVQGWKAGNIMDDAVMANKGTMSASQIQSFLNGKVPSCDTNGTKLSEFGGPDLNKDGKVQRWEWGKSKYNQTTFTCLKNYKQGGKTAAQIIYNAAQKYSINPQVLLVLLQKEQGLVQDTWPLNIQYKSATGYGCPDTAPCDSDYFGLTNQIDWAAKMFRAILNNSPSWYTPYVLGKNYIQYNPSASCGGSTVNIENRATQALYNYTPYQPNKGALNAGWGTASCGAYGNRNFYLYFTSWFGSTRGTISVTGISFESKPYTDNTTTASFTIRNTTKYAVNLGRLKIAVRDANGANVDFPQVDNIRLAAGASYTYKKSRTLNGAEGSYKFFVARYDGTRWHEPPFDDYGQTANGEKNLQVTKQPTLTSALELIKSSDNFHKDQTITARFSIKNNSSKSVDLGYIKPAARDKNGTNVDFPYSERLTLSPGETYSYNKSRTFSTTGKVSVWISTKDNTFGWSDTEPKGVSATTKRSATLNILDNVTLTNGLSISMPNKHATNTATATFTIKNFSAKQVEVGYVKPAGRGPANAWMDFPYSPYLRLNPGESYTYNETRELPSEGQYKFWISSIKNNQSWSDTLPASEVTTLPRSVNMSLKSNVTLSQQLAISMVDPTAGKQATATFKIKNYGTKSVEVGYVKPAVRDSKNTNLDFPYSPYITLSPGQEYTYNQSRVLPTADSYKIWIANLRNGKPWSETFPASEESSFMRKLDYNITNTARLTSAVQLTQQGASTTGSFTIKNFGAKPVEIGYVKPVLRSSKNANYDLPYSPYITLNPGQTYTYNLARNLPAGKYTFWLANLRNGKSWSETFPVSQNSALVRKGTITID